MATAQQKAFCVLKFSTCESVVTVQREFRRRYGTEPPGAQSIRRWYRQFEETGCLCKGKSAGRPRVTNDMLERVWKEFEYRLDVARVTRGSHIEHL
jgi:transposase